MISLSILSLSVWIMTRRDNALKCRPPPFPNNPVIPRENRNVYLTTKKMISCNQRIQNSVTPLTGKWLSKNQGRPKNSNSALLLPIFEPNYVQKCVCFLSKAGAYTIHQFSVDISWSYFFVSAQLLLRPLASS